ncbi:MAG: DUF1292 domain-containing protein, partial [Clostridiales bacterium]|nr:DUF1292 domain-containing protein [Clostridiales bacterium]
DTGEETEFTVEDETELYGVKYLLVSDGSAGDCDAYILKEVSEGDDEAFYQMVSDEEQLAALAKVFSEQADEETQIVF